MNLYSIDFIHYAPRGSEEGIFGFIVADNDESVYEWLKSEPKISEYRNLWNSYKDNEDDGIEFDVYDESYNIVGKESFKERMIRLRGEMYDEDADVHDTYYGLTHMGWSLIKEGITEDELNTLKHLEILIGINITESEK